jgi:hypothetical protein
VRSGWRPKPRHRVSAHAFDLHSYAAEMTREVEQLRAVLEGLRAGFIKKLAGLSDVDARRSTVDTGTNLAGLLQHLTYVESKWFEENVAGCKANGNRSMRRPLSLVADAAICLPRGL